MSHVSYNDCSIFTTEIEVINRAIILIKMKIDKKCIFQIRNPFMLDLLDELLWQIRETHNRIIKFCWVSSHVDIHGNEVADAGAKAALSIHVIH